MITAEEASKLSEKNSPENKSIAELLDYIDDHIKEACKRGDRVIDVSISNSEYFSVIGKVTYEVRMKGFNIVISDHHGPWGVDHVYKNIRISW